MIYSVSVYYFFLRVPDPGKSFEFSRILNMLKREKKIFRNYCTYYGIILKLYLEPEPYRFSEYHKYYGLYPEADFFMVSFAYREQPNPTKCLGVFGLSLYTTERELEKEFGR